MEKKVLFPESLFVDARCMHFRFRRLFDVLEILYKGFFGRIFEHPAENGGEQFSPDGLRLLFKFHGQGTIGPGTADRQGADIDGTMTFSPGFIILVFSRFSDPHHFGGRFAE